MVGKVKPRPADFLPQELREDCCRPGGAGPRRGGDGSCPRRPGRKRGKSRRCPTTEDEGRQVEGARCGSGDGRVCGSRGRLGPPAPVSSGRGVTPTSRVVQTGR